MWSKFGLSEIVLFWILEYFVLNSCEENNSKICDRRFIGSVKESSVLLWYFSKLLLYGLIEYCVNIYFCESGYFIVYCYVYVYVI